jgi:prophage regulatory protein
MSHPLKLCTVKELKTVYGIPYSRQHIWRKQDEGTFPLRVTLGQCRVAFRCAEIEAWLADPVGWSKRATESHPL